MALPSRLARPDVGESRIAERGRRCLRRHCLQEMSMSRAASGLARALVFLLGVGVGGHHVAMAAEEAAAGDWHKVVVQFAQQHLKNPAWGYSHSVRDYQLARELAAADHVKLDDDVLFAAAYLHDMAAFEPWEKSGVDHADQAAAIVDTILKN